MRFIRLITFAAAMSACAHGKMGHVQQPLSQGAINQSQTIYVPTVSTTQVAISGDKAGDSTRTDSIKAEIQQRFNREIVDQLRKKGFQAEAVDAAPAKGLVLSGKVTRIENGSAAARILVGMGAGSANLFTDFKLTEMPADKVISRFEVIATSGGNGGLQAAGSYLKAHIIDGAEKTAEYLRDSNSGKK